MVLGSLRCSGLPRRRLATFSLVSTPNPESPFSGHPQPMRLSFRVKRKPGSYFEQDLLSTAIH